MMGLAALPFRHRELIWELAKREIRDRYAGQAFGALWAIGHPLLLMALYIVIFNFVFPSRIGGTYDLPRDLTVYILSGLIPWLTFQEVLGRASTAITANTNLVKQIVFPIEVLPVKTVLAALPNIVFSTLAFVAYSLLTSNSLPWTLVLLPALVLALVAHMVAACYLLSAVGVYFRDLKDIIAVFTTANLFMTPILFVPRVMPPVFDLVLHLNPFSYMVWAFQDALYFGRFQHPVAWLLFLGSAPIVLALGLRVFNRLKSSFGDAL